MIQRVYFMIEILALLLKSLFDKWNMYKKNYTVINGGQLAKAFESKLDLPNRAIMITFDDGYKDTLENALPVLADLNISATVFLASKFFDTLYIPWARCN